MCCSRLSVFAESPIILQIIGQDIFWTMVKVADEAENRFCVLPNNIMLNTAAIFGTM
jgi:hypothetical protein